MSCIFLQHDSADSIQEVLVSLINNVEAATSKVVEQRKKDYCNTIPTLYSLKILLAIFLVAYTS